MNDSENVIKVFNLLNSKKINNIMLSDNEDGRIGSILDESNLKEIVKSICESNDLVFEDAPEPRHWYDFKINGTAFNLKEGTGKTADNLSSKAGLVYALTGVEIKGNSPHDVALKTISDNFFENSADYGILFFNKINKTFKVSSLKNIDPKNLVSNGSNLPFQIKLGKLDDVLNHSVGNQSVELCKVYLESIKKHNIDFLILADKITEEENT